MIARVKGGRSRIAIESRVKTRKHAFSRLNVLATCGSVNEDRLISSRPSSPHSKQVRESQTPCGGSERRYAGSPGVFTTLLSFDRLRNGIKKQLELTGVATTSGRRANR